MSSHFIFLALFVSRLTAKPVSGTGFQRVSQRTKHSISEMVLNVKPVVECGFRSADFGISPLFKGLDPERLAPRETGCVTADCGIG